MPKQPHDLDIAPIAMQEFTCKQSKHDVVPKLPPRGLSLSLSGDDNTVLLANLILKIYRGCFGTVYIWSQSIHGDSTWEAVKPYQEDVMKVKESEDDKFYYDSYNSEDLEKVIATQHKVISHMKKQQHSHLFSILIIVDDFADSP